jgi:inosine/xanthosine triphosphatase
LSSPLRVCVGSENPAKLHAVRLGLTPFFSDLELIAVAAASGVSEQPIGFDEIVCGARNRARRSYAEGRGQCDLGVGLEDGLVPIAALRSGYVNMGCCVLFDGKQEATGFSSGFEYPEPCVTAATGFHRVPIGDAFDRLFATRARRFDAGREKGNIGRLTQGVLDRSSYGSHAVICAMVRFLHSDLYSRERG